jgi:signal recognition particle receptor subunit beta
MASLNPLTREVVFKIVFYGPGLGGKTTTLQHIHAASKPEHRGKMVSLATPMDRTLYFDFLPLRMPLVHGMHVRLQLFTVPGQVYFGATRKLVLTGADGVVFVADSQTGRQDANQEALEDLVMNLAENNLALLSMPHTFHWNKRDIPDVVSLADLDKTLNRQGAPSLGTVATTGEGVFMGLERITRLVFQAYEAELPKSEVSAGPQSQVVSTPIEETTIADALRGLAEAPQRARTPSGEVPSSSRGAPASAPVSSLESIPNPIPRKTGAFEPVAAPPSTSAGTTASASGQGSPPPVSLAKGGPPPSRGSGERAAVAPVVEAMPPTRGSQALRVRTAPMLHAISPPAAGPASQGAAVVAAAPAVASAAAGAVAFEPSPAASARAPSAPPRDEPRSRRERETRDVATTPPPPPTHALSFAVLWPDADRESARQAEAALAAGDGAGALLVCDVLVTRLLASAAGLTGNAEAPRDPGLVVLLLGLDGRRYLSFRASVRSARAHEQVLTADALEAYAFTLEVRRALAALGW